MGIKKVLAVWTAGVLAFSCLAGCGNVAGSTDSSQKGDVKAQAGTKIQDGAEEENNDPIRIVTTIFPEYDWVCRIVGENPADVQITMLLDKGVDLHSFQPTAEDILQLGTCDLFIYVGGESDAWVQDALKEAVNSDMKVINLMDTLGERVKEEEIVEGMEADLDHEEETEYDEHVWLSVQNASVLCDAIAEALVEIDGAHADTYRSNLAVYQTQLAKLDAEYQEAVDQATEKTVLFGDRFPFRYMTDDYGLTYYAAFAGCSAETEASFETIIFLSGKVDELQLPAILMIDNSDGKIAQTIKNNTASKDQQILKMNSMQSVTAQDVENGADYLGIMQDNLEVLKKALR